MDGKQENKQNNVQENSILIKNASFLQLQGVQRVVDFDKEEINLDTNLGTLVIKGREMNIGQLMLENGQLSVEGDIFSVSFGETKPKKQGRFFKRLTK